MNRWADRLKNTGYSSEVLMQEPLANHCTLRLGGQADYFTSPSSVKDLQILLDFCRETAQNWLVLGGGANVLFADRGVRGVVISTVHLDRIILDRNNLIIGAGCDVSRASEWAAERGLSGLQWIYRMPGSFGGALWMNARCYGYEMADIVESVDVLNPDGKISTLPFRKEDWGYKHSPFQKSRQIILSARIKTTKADPEILQAEMKKIAEDRLTKGHFRKPSAGSTFKNNREFGAPSGVIIDQCGLKGINLGDAAVSDWHANILINRGQASSRDFMNLIRLVQQEVKKQTGFLLEPEVLPLGDWRDE